MHNILEGLVLRFKGERPFRALQYKGAEEGGKWVFSLRDQGANVCLREQEPGADNIQPSILVLLAILRRHN